MSRSALQRDAKEDLLRDRRNKRMLAREDMFRVS